MFIIILFWLGCDSPSLLLLFVPALLPSTLTHLFLPSSPVSLSYFILAGPMCECLGKKLLHGFQFPMAIPNVTSSFLSLVQENINMQSGHYSWSGRYRPSNKIFDSKKIVMDKLLFKINCT